MFEEVGDAVLLRALDTRSGGEGDDRRDGARPLDPDPKQGQAIGELGLLDGGDGVTLTPAKRFAEDSAALARPICVRHPPRPFPVQEHRRP
jgi:hypothetical protein